MGLQHGTGMDRVTSKPAFVAEALMLVAAPACACDAQGMVWTANDAMVELVGAAVEGRMLAELFCVPGSVMAEIRLALLAERRWGGQLAHGGAGIAVDIHSRPLPPSCGIDGATFVFT